MTQRPAAPPGWAPDESLSGTFAEDAGRTGVAAAGARIVASRRDGRMTEVALRGGELARYMREGAAAAGAGQPVEACPYAADGSPAERQRQAAWQRGWAARTGPLVAAVAPADAPPAEGATAVRYGWHGPLIAEGVRTGDNRKFTNLTWADPPIPLKAQFTEDMGHLGSVGVGIITTLTRDAAGLIQATGTWDDTDASENAAEARRQNLEGLMRGVSIDADEGTVSFEDVDGNPIDGDELWDLSPEDEVVMVVDGARIRAATLCYIPAFVEAFILDDELPEDDAAPAASVAASASSGMALTAAGMLAEDTRRRGYAPTAWFADPGLTEPTPVTVSADGRVFGHLATWGTCHIGIDGACVTPPESAADYAYFATGMYETADGDAVAVGTLTMDTGHADMESGPIAAAAHYDNTGTAAAYVNVGESDVGIWVAGALADGLPKAKRDALIRAGSLSGDWRRIAGGLELVAALVVNVPGFPVPRVKARVASGVQTALVASGITKRTPGSGATNAELARLVAREVAAQMKRDRRADTVTTRLRRARGRTLRARIQASRGDR